jgi:RNA 2',3'-cyclic 3'-phosphodiesterase
MAVIRAFIAIELPAEVQQSLEQVMRQLLQHLTTLPRSAVRWVPAGNIHLTLKFLGDVSLANLDMLKEMLLTEVKVHPPFEFSVGGVGAFPNAKSPRVVWVGVQAPPELLTLQRAIESKMEKLGYSREERPFSPHLTLGRVSRNTTTSQAHQIGEALQAVKVGFLGLICAQEVSLFKSDLRSAGSVYTCLLSAPLIEKKEGL